MTSVSVSVTLKECFVLTGEAVQNWVGGEAEGQCRALAQVG